MNLKHYISTLLLMSSAFGFAQENDRNVTVEREYKPVIQDAGKITSVPSVTETTVQKSTATYNDINIPLTVGQNIQTLSAADLELEKRRDPAAAFVRVGLGNYMNNMVDFALPLIKKENILLDIKANHLATFGDMPHSKTNASINFNSFFGKSELLAGVNLGYEYLKYYGRSYNLLGKEVSFDTLKSAGSTLYKEQNLVRISREPENKTLDELRSMPESDILWRFNAFLGFRSSPEKTGTRYEAIVNYNRFDSRNGLTEDMLHTKGGFNNIDGKNRMGIDFELQNMYYSTDLPAASINVWDSYSVFSMNPYYSFERNSWKLRLGVKSSFSFVYGKPFTPSPDIYAEWKIIPENLAIYAGAGGEYKVNTLDVSMSENRYLFSDLRVQDTYTPINAYFGIKFKPVYNILLDAFVSYKYIDNQYFYINKDYASSTINVLHPEESTLFSNRFNVVYSRASLTNVGLRANYNIRNSMNVQFKALYNGWKTYDITTAWQKPKFEADLTSEVRISRSLMANGSIFYKTKREAKLGDMVIEMNPVFDASFGISYTHQNWVTIFGKVNNVFNARYAEFNGYDVQRFNIMAGASFSF